jgi:hypothetical protein
VRLLRRLPRSRTSCKSADTHSMKSCLVLAVFMALAAAAAQPPAPSGSYYGYGGRMLHTWEFHGDATFRHTWIGSGPHTRVRNAESGVYRVSGRYVELQIASEGEVRRLDFKITADGLLLDGVKLKPKRW